MSDKEEIYYDEPNDHTRPIKTLQIKQASRNKLGSFSSQQEAVYESLKTYTDGDMCPDEVQTRPSVTSQINRDISDNPELALGGMSETKRYEFRAGYSIISNQENIRPNDYYISLEQVITENQIDLSKKHSSEEQGDRFSNSERELRKGDIGAVELEMVKDSDLNKNYINEEDRLKRKASSMEAHSKNHLDNGENQTQIEIFQENQTVENIPIVQESTNNQAQAQRQDIQEIQIRNPGLQQVTTVNQTQSLQRFWEPEVKIYLLKAVGLIMAIILFSVLVLLTIHINLPYDVLFLSVQFFFAYLLALDIFWTRRVLGDLWLEGARTSEMCNNAISPILIFMTYLRFLKLLPFYMFVCFPLMVLAIVSFIFTKEDLYLKYFVNMMRLVYTFIIFLISIRADGVIDWDWTLIFVPLWLLLCLKSLFCLKYFISLVKLFTSRPRQQNQQASSENKIKGFGFLWCILYYGLNIIAILTLFGVRQALSEDKSFEVLSIIAYVSIGIGTTLLLYTLVARKLLIQFIIMTQFIQSHLANQEISRRKAHRVVNLQAEKKEAHFVMVSNTYYLPLHQSFNVRDPKDLEMIKMKVRKAKLETGDQSQERGKAHKQITAVNAEALKEFKQGIDQKFSKLFRDSFKEITEKKLRNKPIKINDVSAIDIKEKEVSSNEDEGETNRKMCLSFDKPNQNIALEDNKSPPKDDEQNTLCYICYINQPNAVIVGCGHGGVCFDCLSTLIKKKDECMECRKKMEAIHKINTSPIFSNIFKGTEVYKIVIETGDN